MARKTKPALETASDVIDFYGGTKLAADKFGTKMSAVSNWRRVGIPYRLHRKIYLDMRRRRVKMARSLFD